MGKAIDMRGRVYGRLTVVGPAPKRNCAALYWLCECQCGKRTEINGTNLRLGLTKSCGCLNQENRCRRDNKITKHGHSGSLTYASWTAMRSRCRRRKNKDWHRYGGAGITVCERWRDSFENFLADMGERPSRRHTLDRYPDPAGDYEPTNCRWATHAEQSSNKIITATFTAFGKTKHIDEWCREYAIGRSTVRERLCRGWSVEEALSTPVLKKGREILHDTAPRQSMAFRRRTLSGATKREVVDA